MSNQTDEPAWNAPLAECLPGKLLLIGLTIETPGQDETEMQQFYGRVLVADPEQGIQLELGGEHAGRIYWLPPDTRTIRPAPPGDYRLRATGEVVENPDYTCVWVLTRPSSNP